MAMTPEERQTRNVMWVVKAFHGLLLVLAFCAMFFLARSMYRQYVAADQEMRAAYIFLTVAILGGRAALSLRDWNRRRIG